MDCNKVDFPSSRETILVYRKRKLENNSFVTIRATNHTKVEDGIKILLFDRFGNRLPSFLCDKLSVVVDDKTKIKNKLGNIGISKSGSGCVIKYGFSRAGTHHLAIKFPEQKGDFQVKIEVLAAKLNRSKSKLLAVSKQSVFTEIEVQLRDDFGNYVELTAPGSFVLYKEFCDKRVEFSRKEYFLPDSQNSAYLSRHENKFYNLFCENRSLEVLVLTETYKMVLEESFELPKNEGFHTNFEEMEEPCFESRDRLLPLDTSDAYIKYVIRRCPFANKTLFKDFIEEEYKFLREMGDFSSIVVSTQRMLAVLKEFD